MHFHIHSVSVFFIIFCHSSRLCLFYMKIYTLREVRAFRCSKNNATKHMHEKENIYVNRLFLSGKIAALSGVRLGNFLLQIGHYHFEAKQKTFSSFCILNIVIFFLNRILKITQKWLINVFLLGKSTLTINHAIISFYVC